MPYLQVTSGPDKGSVFKLTTQKCTIGREESETIQIFDSSASRSHAEITSVGEMYFIRDLKSRNGTFVNEESIGEEMLRAGDKIRIGKTIFAFQEEAKTNVKRKKDIIYEQETDNMSKTISYKIEDLLVDGQADLDEETAQARPRSNNLKNIYKLSKVFVGKHKKMELLEKTLSITTNAINGEYGYVFMKDASGNLEPVASFEAERLVSSTPEMVVSNTILKRVLVENRPVITKDAEHDSRFNLEESIVTKQVKSVICVPIVAFENTSGLIYISRSAYEQPFSTEDFELVTVTAIQLGMALEIVNANEKERALIFRVLKSFYYSHGSIEREASELAEKVAEYSSAMGEAIGFDKIEIDALKTAAFLAEIIKQQSEPSADAQKEQAPQAKSSALESVAKNLPEIEHLIPAIKHSTERWDGEGYPDGISGKRIPVFSRIIAVASAFCNIPSPEKGVPQTPKQAFLEINRRATDGEFDPNIVRALMVAYRRGLMSKRASDA